MVAIFCTNNDLFLLLAIKTANQEWRVGINGHMNVCFIKVPWPISAIFITKCGRGFPVRRSTYART